MPQYSFMPQYPFILCIKKQTKKTLNLFIYSMETSMIGITGLITLKGVFQMSSQQRALFLLQRLSTLHPVMPSCASLAKVFFYCLRSGSMLYAASLNNKRARKAAWVFKGYSCVNNMTEPSASPEDPWNKVSERFIMKKFVASKWSKRSQFIRSQRCQGAVSQSQI